MDCFFVTCECNVVQFYEPEGWCGFLNCRTIIFAIYWGTCECNVRFVEINFAVILIIFLSCSTLEHNYECVCLKNMELIEIFR